MTEADNIDYRFGYVDHCFHTWLAVPCNCSTTNFQVPVVKLALAGGNSLEVVSGLKSIVDDVSSLFS